MRDILILAAILCLGRRTDGVVEITQIYQLAETAVLACHVRFVRQTPVVMWDKELANGQLTRIATGLHVARESSRISVNKPAGNEWNLMIRTINRNDEGVYKCHAIDSHNVKQVVSRIRVQIQTKPTIIDHASSPRHLTAVEFDTVTLWCNATGTPRPNVTWYRRSPSDEDGQASLVSLGVSGSQLTIHNVTRYMNHDVFMCEATNEISFVTREINVTVTFAPEVVALEDVVTGAMGEPVVISCAAQGSPLYQVYWRDNTGTRIGPNKPWKYLIIEDRDGVYPVSFLTLMIRQLEHRDYGTYTCHADGQHGDAEVNVMLKTPDQAEGQVIRYDV